jgi:two-component system, LytTR family, response regulator
MVQISKETTIIGSNINHKHRERQYQFKKIGFCCGSYVGFVDANQIVFCESYANYTLIYLYNKNKILVSHNIGYVYDKLNYQCFVRCHMKFLVNINFISKMIKNDGLVMDGFENIVIPLSRDRKTTLINILSI